MLLSEGFLDHLGVNVIETDRVSPGELYGFDGGLLMHPLDVIAIKHRDPFERLEAAQDWIVGRAHRKLDALAARIAKGDV